VGVETAAWELPEVDGVGEAESEAVEPDVVESGATESPVAGAVAEPDPDDPPPSAVTLGVPELSAAGATWSEVVLDPVSTISAANTVVAAGGSNARTAASNQLARDARSRRWLIGGDLNFIYSSPLTWSFAS
jgi:hypothetical protein